MHGDDVASAGTQIVGEAAKGTVSLVFQYILKILERRHQDKLHEQEMDLKREELAMKYENEHLPEIHGEQKTLAELKKGGELANVTIPKEDYEAFKKANKEINMPYMGFTDKDSDMVDMYFLRSDEQILKPAMDKILSDKLSAPEQQYKMTMIDADKAEAFQSYCTEKGITTNMLETSDSKFKCVYRSDSEMKIQKALEAIEAKKNELANMSADIEMKGNKPQFVINDIDSGRKIRFNFGTKERFERALTEHLGYDPDKAKLASQVVFAKLTGDQKKAFLSGSKLLERIDSLQKNIRFHDDSLLVGDFDFSTMKLSGNESHLVITDNDGNMAAIPESMKDRAQVEEILRRELGLTDKEQIKDMMKKVEKTGYTNKTAVLKQGEYEIKRTSKDTAEVSLDDKIITIDLNDRKASRKTLENEFGMSDKKADKILDKASKQSATKGILSKARSVLPEKSPMIEHKKPSRGSRK